MNILENASGGEYKWWEILTHIVPIWILFMVYPIKEFFQKSAHFAILTIYSQKLANLEIFPSKVKIWITESEKMGKLFHSHWKK